MNRSRSAVVLGLVSALLLSGCSDDPVPKVAPPPDSPSESVTESPSPSGSASQSPRDEQEAFINEYVATISDSLASGETSTFVKLSSVNCENCLTLARNIQRAYVGGGHIEGGYWEVATLERAQETSTRGTIWNVDVKTTRERWFDGDDRLVKIIRPSTQRFGVIVARDTGRLILEDLRLRG